MPEWERSLDHKHDAFTPSFSFTVASVDIILQIGPSSSLPGTVVLVLGDAAGFVHPLGLKVCCNDCSFGDLSRSTA